MNQYSVKMIMKSGSNIQLPQAVFHGCSCHECIHYRRDEGRDSQGQYRCSYRGRWYFPHEGCGNGESIYEYHKRKQEELDKQIADIEVPDVSVPKQHHSPPSISSSSHHGSSSSSDSGSSGGFVIIAIILISIFISIRNWAADTGIIKSSVRFRTSNESGIELTVEPDGATIVSASDPGTFYTLNFDTEEDVEAPKRKLVKGTYYQYANEDRMSVSCGSFTVDGYSGYTKRIPVEAVQAYNMVNTLVLTLTDADKKSISGKEVMVTGEDGFEYACTAYGKEGTYIVLLFDDNLTAASGTLSIRVAGYSDASAEFDFSENRICEQTITLTKE